MAKDRTVQPDNDKTQDPLRFWAGAALAGFVLAVGASGMWRVWELVVLNGVPFSSGIRAFVLIVGCLAANGILAWVMTRSWEKEEGVRSSS